MDVAARGLGAVTPIVTIRGGFARGQANVRRRGIYDDTVEVKDTLFPVEGLLGARLKLQQDWNAVFGYGLGMEILTQEGSGSSDSATGMFASDCLELGLSASIHRTLWLGAKFKSHGLLRTGGGLAGSDSISLAATVPLGQD
jgi:hypothetical protein